MIGSVISHYKILEKIGEGGMGLVYKAEDLKLTRTVALKFLPPDLTRDPDAKRRFMLEAKAASSLDHPNICTVHDIGETDDGQIFIVMALCQGETLKKKIERGPLKFEDTLEIAIQVLQGLAKAHEHGIVHRDIKPANILVTNDRIPKIVDFGLAKLTGRTLLTKAGSTLGTVAYMSPEQTKGDPVDHRTDIWSAGVVIYEMVSGQLPFRGDYDNAVMYSIANADPEPLTALRTGVPMELERIVMKALKKKQEERYQHVSDMLVDLRVLRRDLPQVKTSSRDSEPSRPSQRVIRWGQLTPWLVALFMVLAVGVALWKPWSGPIEANQRPSRFAVTLSEGDSLIGSESPDIAISRDGRKLAYVAVQNGVSRLYIRSLDSLNARPISGTEGARAPFFSPDGNWVAFFAGGLLRKISLLGGAPQTICQAATLGGAWGPDNTIVFVKWEGIRGLYRVQADGSGLRCLTEGAFGAPFNIFSWPEFLPGTKTLLITRGGGMSETDIAVVSMETGEIKSLFRSSGYARYSPTGHILHSRPAEGDVWAVPFDIDDLEIGGSPFPVLEGVKQFALAETGTLMSVPGGGAVRRDTVALVNRKGGIKHLPVQPGTFHGFRFSPDGRRLVFSWHQSKVNLWIYDFDRNVLRRFTDEQGADWTPLWTPDGKGIVYQSSRAGRGMRLFLKALDGEGSGEMLTETDFHQQPGCWSPDGKALIFQEGVHPETLHDIMLLSLGGERKPRPLIQTQYNERFPMLSPDGCWLAFCTDESGRWEVYARRYPGLNEITRISSDGGIAPLWGPDGSELFFWDTNRQTLVSVAVRAGSTLQIGEPKLFARGKFSFGSNGWYRNYDISPDGRYLVMLLKGTSGPRPRQFNVVLNWFEELRAREHGVQ